jgi:hypothetical protein
MLSMVLNQQTPGGRLAVGDCRMHLCVALRLSGRHKIQLSSASRDVVGM